MKKTIAYIGAAMALSCNPMNIDNLLDTVPGQEDTCRTQMEEIRDRTQEWLAGYLCPGGQDPRSLYLVDGNLPEACGPLSNQYMPGWNQFRGEDLNFKCPDGEELKVKRLYRVDIQR